MRVLLFGVYVLIFYWAARALLRWLIQARAKPERRDAGMPPDGEMVRDPECGAYVLKERAVLRRLKGADLYFCGEDCAAAHAARGGS